MFLPYTGMPSLAPHPSAILSLFTVRSLLFSVVRFRPHRSFLCQRCESTLLISAVPPRRAFHRLTSASFNQSSSQVTVRDFNVLFIFRPLQRTAVCMESTVPVAQKLFAEEVFPSIAPVDAVFYQALRRHPQKMPRTDAEYLRGFSYRVSRAGLDVRRLTRHRQSPSFS